MAEDLVTSAISDLRQISTSLYSQVCELNSQRTLMVSVKADLESLLDILLKITEHAIRPQEISLMPLLEPLKCCTETCQEMSEMFQGAASSVQTLLRMRYLERTFDDMRTRLASYLSVLSIAFQLANRYEREYSPSNKASQMSGSMYTYIGQKKMLDEN